MKINEIKTLLEKKISDSNGLRDLDILFDPEVIQTNLGFEEILNLLKKLVAEKRVMELEYAIPHRPKNLEFLYLPIGTRCVLTSVGNRKTT